MVRRGVRAALGVCGLIGAVGCPSSPPASPPPAAAASPSPSPSAAPVTPTPLSAATTPVPAQAEMITFYRAYVTAVGAVPPDEARVQALRKRHTTAAWQARHGRGDADADPILLAQDVGDGWADRVTATVESDAQTLRVCMADHCVRVRVVQEADGWKIDELLL
jgi:hypothetical protein